MKPMLLLTAFVALVVAPSIPAADFLGKSADVWARDLSSEKPEVRRSAAFALGKIGTGAESNLPQLAELVRADRDPGVRAAAAAAIGDVIAAGHGSGAGRWGSVWPALRAGLKDTSPLVKRSAAYAVGTFGPDAAEAVADLKGALTDAVPTVRQNAAWALGRLGKAASADIVDLLCSRLRDDDPLVRRDAASALGDIGLPTASRAWKPLLDLVRPGGRQAATRRTTCCCARALAKVVILLPNESAAIAKEINNFLSVNNKPPFDDACDRVLKNLGGIGLPDASAVREPALKNWHDALKSGDGANVLAALNELARLGEIANKDVGPQLAPINALLGNDDPETSRLAAFVLAHVGGPSARAAVPVLIKALHDADSIVQEQAATFLGEMGADAAEAMSALADALRPGHTGSVRARAAVALVRMGPQTKRITPQLLEALRSEETPDTFKNQVRRYIAEVFVQMGFPNTKDAMPNLLDFIARDANLAVRHRCIGVFILMDPDFFQQLRSTSGRSAADVLTATLSDPALDKAPLVRYDAARALAFNLRDQAPDKAVEVLLHMLNNVDLVLYKGTEATVTGVGREGSSGNTNQKDIANGDARFLAAEALGVMGKKANRRDVRQALEKAKSDTKDVTGRLQKEAEKALSQIDK